MEEGMERLMGCHGLLEGMIDGWGKDSLMMQVRICGMVDGGWETGDGKDSSKPGLQCCVIL